MFYLLCSFFEFLNKNFNYYTCTFLFSRKRKRNWEILQLRIKQMKLKREQQSSEKPLSWQRNQQWLKKLQSKYDQMKKVSKTLITESSM